MFFFLIVFHILSTNNAVLMIYCFWVGHKYCKYSATKNPEFDSLTVDILNHEAAKMIVCIVYKHMLSLWRFYYVCCGFDKHVVEYTKGELWGDLFP